MTHLLLTSSVSVALATVVALPVHAESPAGATACFGMNRGSSPATSYKASSGKPESSGKSRKQNSADARRSRSSQNQGFSWFGAKQGTSTRTAQSSRNASTYPVVNRFGNTTTVKVNGTQRPATIHHDVLDSGSASSSQVIIDIASQRGYLLMNGRVAIDTPVSTAAAGMVTPTGTYTITEKVRSGKMSTIYHCAMPNWMRLGGTAYGMHTGYLPGYPASHGCVRLPGYVAPYIFDHTRSGTRVAIRSSWSGNCEEL